MKVAIMYEAAQVDAEGHVTGHDAGATLVRRLLRVFPGAMLVGPGTRHCAGFDVIPLEFIDGSETVVINMDSLDSLGVWQTLKANCDEPRLMNFVWWNTSQFTHQVQRATLALSCALFPTFANSQRTASEVREIVSAWAVQPIAEQAMRLSRKDWTWVGPLTASREDYWEALARTTAFLATAVEESYGLEYIEALVAGAVGVFPALPWARAILPEGYPFFYRTAAEAETMLYRAVTDTAACRQQLDDAVEGSFAQWLRARHDDDLFEKAIADRVTEWFGA